MKEKFEKIHLIEGYPEISVKELDNHYGFLFNLDKENGIWRYSCIERSYIFPFFQGRKEDQLKPFRSTEGLNEEAISELEK